MAYIRRHPKSPFWIAGFNLPSGQRTQRSTKTTDKKLAMKLAQQWEQASARRITEAQARRVLSDIHEEIHGERLLTPTVTEFIKQWLDRKKAETVAVTFVSYKHAVEEFEEFLAERASQPLHYVTPAQIAKWRDAAAAKATASTANNKLKIVRVLFQSAWRDGLLTDNPAAKVTGLKTVDSARRPFTLPELKNILRVASQEWRGIILARIYTGQRLKDIASLTWQNVDMERGEIRFATSKTARRQIIPIAEPLAAYLGDLSTSDDPAAPLFPSAFPHGLRDGGTSALSTQFHLILSNAGLVTARDTHHGGKGKGRTSGRARNPLSFHSLRYTATSLLKNAGVSEAVARDIIGHESAEISRHYTHVDEATKRKAIALLPDFTKGL